MIVGGGFMACCCDAPINYPTCNNTNTASNSESVYSLEFSISVTYMDRFRPANPSGPFDDVVSIYDPARVAPGTTPPSNPCPHAAYTPVSYEFNAKLTHATNWCDPRTPGTCRTLRQRVAFAPVTSAELAVPGSTATYAIGGTRTATDYCSNPQNPPPPIPMGSGFPRVETVIADAQGNFFAYPSYLISWGCNQASTVGGSNGMTTAATVAHPDFGFYGPRMEIVVIEVGRMGLETGCDSNGDPITRSVSMSHSAPPCTSTGQPNCCQYGMSTVLTYWRPLQSDPTAPDFCFTPGTFALHTVQVPFRCFIVPPQSAISDGVKRCSRIASSIDPRGWYMGQSGSGGPNGQPNRSNGLFGLYQWSPALGQAKPDVVNIAVPSAITIG